MARDSATCQVGGNIDTNDLVPPTLTLPLKGGGNCAWQAPSPQGGRTLWHQSRHVACGATRRKPKSGFGCISATSNSAGSVSADSSRSVPTSSISSVRMRNSSLKSTADSIRPNATRRARYGLKSVVIASCDFGTTMFLEIPKGFGRRLRKFYVNARHPNPPPQGGREEESLSLQSPRADLPPAAEDSPAPGPSPRRARDHAPTASRGFPRAPPGSPARCPRRQRPAPRRYSSTSRIMSIASPASRAPSRSSNAASTGRVSFSNR
jgi:hypothetical protein